MGSSRIGLPEAETPRLPRESKIPVALRLLERAPHQRPFNLSTRIAHPKGQQLSPSTIETVMHPLRLLAALSTLLGSALLVGCSQGEASADAPPAAPPPVPALVTTAEVRTLQSEVSTVGSLRSPETTTVAADVSGIIVSLSAPEGRRIQAGSEIARLDDAESRAALRVAEARHRNAQVALERAKPLVADGVVPQQTLDDAEAEMATAEGLLEEAQTRLAKTRIVAPFGGLVGIQTAQVGQYVSSGDPIIQLTQLDPLELVFGVPEDRAADVAIGQKLSARVGRCGVDFTATVQALDSQIDPQARTLAVQARVRNGERKLIPGMSAQVRLPVGEARERIVVPREALVAQGTTYQVWIVGDDDTVRPQQVTPGRNYPDVVEIASGLEPGTRIVAAGHQKLRPGARVIAQEWQPTDNPNLDRGLDERGDCLP